jgi:hypothetical protein
VSYSDLVYDFFHYGYLLGKFRLIF